MLSVHPSRAGHSSPQGLPRYPLRRDDLGGLKEHTGPFRVPAEPVRLVSSDLVMRIAQHVLRSFVLVVTLLGLPCLALAQRGDEVGPPRTPWGVRDLQGTWSLPTMTPLERPAGYEDRPRLTGAEAGEFLTTRRSRIRQALPAERAGPIG